jgi:hypothetical protein
MNISEKKRLVEVVESDSEYFAIAKIKEKYGRESEIRRIRELEEPGISSGEPSMFYWGQHPIS